MKLSITFDEKGGERRGHKEVADHIFCKMTIQTIY